MGPPMGKGTKFIVWTLGGTGMVAVALLAAAALLPRLVASESVKGRIRDAASRLAGGPVTFERLEITLFPRPGVVIQLTNAILESAKAAGADCVMVGCPLCHGNLDIRQKEIEGVFNASYSLPIFYITQLVGLAAGLSADKLGLDALIVNPLPLLKGKKLL